MTDYMTPEISADATDIQIERRYAVIRMSDRVVAAPVLLAREFARVCVKQKETEMVADLHRSNMRREERPTSTLLFTSAAGFSRGYDAGLKTAAAELAANKRLFDAMAANVQVAESSVTYSFPGHLAIWENQRIREAWNDGYNIGHGRRNLEDTEQVRTR